jgi:hypothetical protein
MVRGILASRFAVNVAEKLLVIGDIIGLGRGHGHGQFIWMIKTGREVMESWEVMEREVMEREVMEREVMEREVMEREVMEREVMEREVMESSSHLVFQLKR